MSVGLSLSRDSGFPMAGQESSWSFRKPDLIEAAPEAGTNGLFVEHRLDVFDSLPALGTGGFRIGHHFAHAVSERLDVRIGPNISLLVRPHCMVDLDQLVGDRIAVLLGQKVL